MRLRRLHHAAPTIVWKNDVADFVNSTLYQQIRGSLQNALYSVAQSAALVLRREKLSFIYTWFPARAIQQIYIYLTGNEVSQFV